MGTDYKRLLREFQEFEAKRKLLKVYTEKEKPPAIKPEANEKSSFYRGPMDVV